LPFLSASMLLLRVARLLLLGRLHLDMQLAQLSGRNRRWRFRHETCAFGSFRKSNDITNAWRATKDCIQPVEPKGYASMRRSAIFESFEHVTEAQLRFFGGNLQYLFKDQFLQLSLVNSDRTATQFHAVDDDIVVLAAHFLGFGLKQRYILRNWSGKGMVT